MQLHEQKRNKDSELNGNYVYDKTGNLEKWLTHLAQIRILGGKKYDEFYSTGANSWFNDEDKIHENIEQSIDNVQYCASILNLEISNKLAN